MMKFARGMLGLAVTTIAIMGTVILGFGMSVSTEEQTVESWDYLANVSGMFDTDKTKQYVEYSPPANWTGYRSSTGTATENISYSVSSNANLYPINQESTSVTFSQSAPSSPSMPSPPTSSALLKSWGIVFNSTDSFKPIYGYNDGNVTCNKPTVVTLRTIYTTLNGSDYDQIVIKVGGTNYPMWSNASDWTESTWRYDAGGMIQTFTVWTYNTDYASTSIPTGTITISTATMSATYTQSGATPQALGNLDDVYLVYGGSGTADDQYTIGNTLSGSKDTYPTPIYMDISKGVSISNNYAYWTNGYETSQMTILFHAPTVSGSYNLNLYCSNADSTNGITTITIDYTSSQDLYVTASYNSVYVQTTIGGWRNALVSVDLINQAITITPIIRYTSMTNYTTSDITETLDFSSIGSRCGPYTLFRFSTSSSPIFGIVSTQVFMNTYGAVMVDPTIDVYSLFPGMTESLRLSFRSFAIYGDSIIVWRSDTSAVSFSVSNGTVQINGKNVSLSNGLTFDYRYLGVGLGYSLTISSEGEKIVEYSPIDGTKVELSGNWYMETEVFKSVQTTETVSEFDFKTFVFDSNQAIIAYLGLLVLGTAVGARYAGASWIDMIIVLFAGICGYLLLAVA